MEPLAHVALALGVPDEVARLLRLAGIDTVAEEQAQSAAVLVRLASSDPHRETLEARLVADDRTDSQSAEFPCDNPYAAACFILSRALRLTAPFLTGNAATFSVVQAALMAARTRVGIVIEGETGTGKESLIKLIHAASGANANLVRFDCTGSDLADAQLDSLAAMATADGTASPDGLEWAADTLFLDRVDELSRDGQLRLLEMIGEPEQWAAPGTYAPLRYTAATTHSLARMAERGAIEPELCKLFQVTLTIPPLRRRREDIPMLARHFLDSVKPHLKISRGAMRMLCAYPFPGNVRELQNLATRLAIVCAGEVNSPLTCGDMLTALISGNVAGAAGASLWKLSPRSLRREIARQALSSFGGDTAAAARSLGLEPYALSQFGGAGGSKARKSRTARDA